MLQLFGLALALASLADARVSKRFSILPDVYSSPKFGLVFSKDNGADEAVEVTTMRLGDRVFECGIPQAYAANTRPEFNETELLSTGLEIVNKTEECLVHLDVYWGYQLCPGKRILQFRPQWISKSEFVFSDGKPYDLGRFTTPNAVLGSKNDQTYLRISYTDGEICDLTERPRTSEVLYFCDPEIKLLKLDSVHEVSTCQYEVYVAHPDLCDIEGFRPHDGHTNEIRCAEIVGGQPVDLDAEDNIFPMFVEQPEVVLVEDAE